MKLVLNNMEYRTLNNLQTPLNEEYLKQFPKEVAVDLLDYVDNIKFISNLTSPYRKKVSDLDKDSDGRIKVDLTNPHILENMEFFTERASHFKKYGCYTKLLPNPHPQSEYTKFWAEEKRRWKHGLVREDGEWIPGMFYVYLNYCPIWQPIKVGNRLERKLDFPQIWLGDYLFYHYLDQCEQEGKHAKLLKARSRGFSYKMGCIGPRNCFIFPGQPNYYLAADKTYLEGDGVFAKVTAFLDFISSNTPFPKLRLIDTKLEIQLGYKDEYGLEKGLKSRLVGISLKDNPNKARGIRAKFVDYEEDGVFPNLESSWNINRSAAEDGGKAFALMVSGGTGGTKDSSFEGSRKLFYSPETYNILGIPNVFDKGSSGEKTCGFFWGEYLNRSGCYNANGEPDVIKALGEILVDWYNVKYNSTDPIAITQRMAEMPITPQHAIMRVDGTIFPVADLRHHYEAIMPNINNIYANNYIGELGLDKGEVTWKPKADIYPIRKFPHLSNKVDGAVEIFEMPKNNNDPYRYIAGVDTLDDDGSTTSSLGSIFIMDSYTDRIVAEYTGRPKFADEFYEICRRLLLFYNAKCNYENNKKGLFTYFSNRFSLPLLTDTLQVLRDIDIVKGELYGNKAKGTCASKEINAYARRLLRDWLLKPAYTSEENNLKLNLHTIKSVPLLEELMAWNPDGNFDRVSAMMMLMLLREDRSKREEGKKVSEFKKSTGFAGHEFFDKNFKWNKNFSQL